MNQREGMEKSRFEWTHNIEGCMSPEQLEAHRFLITSKDFVQCPQGLLLRLSACELRQQSFDHHQHAWHIWQPDEEPTSTKFMACVEFNCHHYTPRKQRISNPGKTPRYFAQAKAASEAKEQAMQGKHKFKAAKLAAWKAEMAAKIAARKAEKQAKRDQWLAQLQVRIEKAKRFHRNGKSFAWIAKHLGVGKTTVFRWFAGEEATKAERKKWNDTRSKKGSVDV